MSKNYYAPGSACHTILCMYIQAEKSKFLLFFSVQCMFVVVGYCMGSPPQQHPGCLHTVNTVPSSFRRIAQTSSSVHTNISTQTASIGLYTQHRTQEKCLLHAPLALITTTIHRIAVIATNDREGTAQPPPTRTVNGYLSNLSDLYHTRSLRPERNIFIFFCK